MTPPTLQEIEDAIEEKLESLFDQVSAELETVIGDMEERVRGWLAAVVTGDLSPEEFKELVEGEKALLEMTVLQKSVNAKALANTIKNVLLETVLGTVERLLK